MSFLNHFTFVNTCL